MLHHPRGVRERILAMGSYNSGKTRAWLSIARLAQLTKSPAQFYVIDTDYATDHMMSTDSSIFRNLTNVHITEVLEWPEYIDAARNLRKKMTHDDWLIVDMCGPAWSAVQDWFIESVHGIDPEQYFIQIRKEIDEDEEAAKKKRGGFEGRKDWGYINKCYRQFSAPLAAVPGNLFMCTSSKKIEKDELDKPEWEDFRKHGVRPDGQKHTGHLVHTIMRMQETNNGWKMTTIKDRERVALKGEPVQDFARDYLLKVAGWKL